ncbi:ArsR family transcriptional regulator [Herbaspirillum sp. HC18]|nr:ArsR family transcriptional regulator [Herbaspirillum sp. HC18]
MSRNNDNCLSPEMQDLLKALANETRQRIMFLFVDGRPRSVGEIAEQIGIGQSTASEHLTQLRRGGAVKSQRMGKEVYYCPDQQRLLETLRQLTALLTVGCPPAK